MLASVFFASAAQAAPEHYRHEKTAAGTIDYYLVRGPIVEGHQSVYSLQRSSTSGDWYTLTLVDCRTRRYAFVSDGPSLEKQREAGGALRWTGVVAGSSKADMVRHVCK
jgi:hypothetical protein